MSNSDPREGREEREEAVRFTDQEEPQEAQEESPESNGGGAGADVLAAGAKAAVGSSEAGQKAIETAAKTKKAVTWATTKASQIKNGVQVAAPLLSNWVFWVILAAVVVIVLVVSIVLAGLQTVGKNENATGCIADSSGSLEGVPVATSEDKVATANSIAGWMTTTSFSFIGNKPMSVDQAFAIIGNWSQESGLNPGAVQGGSVSPTDPNSAVLSMTGGGKAVGLAQWDGGRRSNLASFAEGAGGHWADATVQLNYFKSELDGAEGTNLAGGGFDDQTKTLEELTVIFEKEFERAGIPMMENRIKAAQDYKAQYNGGYSPVTGGSCVTAKGAVDTSSVVSLAVSLSLPSVDASYVGPGDSFGEQKAPQAYKDAKTRAQAETGADAAPNLYASCDRFVATVLRLTVDPDIPWGAVSAQYAHLSSSSKWQKYTDQSEAQPGDVWITPIPAHVGIYTGNVDGRDTLAHASYMERVSGLGNASWISNFTDSLGRKYVGFRYIGG